MRRRTVMLTVLIPAIAAANHRLAAQASGAAVTAGDTSAYRHRLLGLFDERSGDPIAAAEVRDLYTGTTAVTTATGTVSLEFLPVGRTLIGVRKLGYLPRTLLVTISPRDTAALTLLLTPQATVLPTVTTTDSALSRLPPMLRAFEERRKTGLGRYIDEAHLRANDGHQMSTVLATLPGLRVQSGRVVGTHGTSAGPVIGSAGRPCYATIYQDGAMIYQDAFQLRVPPGDRQPPPDFRRLNADEYSAVEYYASPAEYPPWISPTDNACGVLLLWSRSR